MNNIYSIICGIFLLLSCLLFVGCGTTSYVTIPSNTTTEKSNCYERYQIAIKECDSFLSQQINPAIKDRQMIKCLSIKGFSKGLDGCN